MNKIYIYSTFSLKEIIKGGMKIEKNLYRIVSFSRSKMVVAIQILKYHSLALEIPLFGINTTPSQPIKWQDFIEPCYKSQNTDPNKHADLLTKGSSNTS